MLKNLKHTYESACLIEEIHYYLTYESLKEAANHISDLDRRLLASESNVLYYTSRIAHRLINNAKPNLPKKEINKIYFVCYSLCLKWLYDIQIGKGRTLAMDFGIYFDFNFCACELYCLRALNFSFEFLEKKPNKWKVYND